MAKVRRMEERIANDENEELMEQDRWHHMSGKVRMNEAPMTRMTWTKPLGQVARTD